MTLYRMQSCSHTGTRRHQFDAVTHQCPCGKWARGHAPVKEFVKPRAECQICEGVQATDSSGRLGHHGYQRPGWGFIEGDCMGVGYSPYPATDALERYLEAVKNVVASRKKALAELPHKTEIAYSYEVCRGPERGQNRVLKIKRGDVAKWDRETGEHVHSFEHLEACEQLRLEAEIENGQKEVSRVSARIRAASQPLANVS